MLPSFVAATNAVQVLSTSTTVAIPSGMSPGDILIVVYGWKPTDAETSTPQVNTSGSPRAMTPIGTKAYSGGQGYGTDSGPTRISAAYTEVDGSETSIDIGVPSGVVGWAQSIAYNGGDSWSVAVASGDDVAGSSNWSMTATSTLDVAADDVVLTAICLPTNTGQTWSADALTGAGLTASTWNVIEKIAIDGVATDLGGRTAAVDIVSASGSTTLTHTATVGSNFAAYGPELLVRIRAESGAPPTEKASSDSSGSVESDGSVSIGPQSTDVSGASESGSVAATLASADVSTTTENASVDTGAPVGGTLLVDLFNSTATPVSPDSALWTWSGDVTSYSGSLRLRSSGAYAQTVDTFDLADCAITVRVMPGSGVTLKTGASAYTLAPGFTFSGPPDSTTYDASSTETYFRFTVHDDYSMDVDVSTDETTWRSLAANAGNDSTLSLTNVRFEIIPSSVFDIDAYGGNAVDMVRIDSLGGGTPSPVDKASSDVSSSADGQSVARSSANTDDAGADEDADVIASQVSTDAVTGTDTADLAASNVQPDGVASADAEMLSVSVAQLDSSDATEQGSVGVSLADAETATSSDSESLDAQTEFEKSSADASASAESSVVIVAISDADIGVGGDDATISALGSSADTAAVIDAASIAVDASDTESTLATDAEARSAELSNGDTATAIEASSPVAISGAGDNAAASDDATTVVTVSDSDAAVSLDIGSVIGGDTKSDNEIASAVESATVNVTATGADITSATDIAAISAAVTSADPRLVVDASHITQSRASAESIASHEQSTTTARLSNTDTGLTADVIAGNEYTFLVADGVATIEQFNTSAALSESDATAIDDSAIRSLGAWWSAIDASFGISQNEAAISHVDAYTEAVSAVASPVEATTSVSRLES